jgi:hypothetical protein
MVSSAHSHSGLADHLVARRRVRRAHLDERTHIIELEVVRVRTELGYADLVLGVAGVGHPLGTHRLVGVVTRLGDVERLDYAAALGLLLEVLVEL